MGVETEKNCGAGKEGAANPSDAMLRSWTPLCQPVFLSKPQILLRLPTSGPFNVLLKNADFLGEGQDFEIKRRLQGGRKAKVFFPRLLLRDKQSRQLARCWYLASTTDLQISMSPFPMHFEIPAPRRKMQPDL